MDAKMFWFLTPFPATVHILHEMPMLHGQFLTTVSSVTRTILSSIQTYIRTTSNVTDESLCNTDEGRYNAAQTRFVLNRNERDENESVQ